MPISTFNNMNYTSLLKINGCSPECVLVYVNSNGMLSLIVIIVF